MQLRAACIHAVLAFGRTHHSATPRSTGPPSPESSFRARPGANPRISRRHSWRSILYEAGLLGDSEQPEEKSSSSSAPRIRSEPKICFRLSSQIPPTPWDAAQHHRQREQTCNSVLNAMPQRYRVRQRMSDRGFGVRECQACKQGGHRHPATQFNIAKILHKLRQYIQDIARGENGMIGRYRIVY